MPNDEKQSATDIDVGYVAHLARLHLTDAERDLFQAQLEQVVAYVHQMDALDLDGVEPTAHVRPIQNVFRPDRVGAGLAHAAVMANAPETRDGLFQVPRIME